MKFIISVLLGVLAISFSSAQTFVKTYTSPDTSKTFIINNIEVIENNELLISGLDFRNGLIAKSSAEGTIEWAKEIITDTIYGTYVSSCMDIHKLQNGDIGIGMARINFDTSDKLIVIRLDSEGNLLWSKRFPEIRIQGSSNLQMQISEVEENIIVSGIAIDKEQGDRFFVLHLSSNGTMLEGFSFKHSSGHNYVHLAQASQADHLFLAAAEEEEEGDCHLLEYNVNTREIAYSGEVNVSAWYIEDIEIDSEGQRYLLFAARQDTGQYKSIVTQLTPNYDFEWNIAFEFGRRLLATEQQLNVLGNVSDKIAGLIKLDKGSGDYQSIHLYNSASFTPTVMPSLAPTSEGNAIWHFFAPSTNGAGIINTAPDGTIESCPHFTGCSMNFVRGGAPEINPIDFNRTSLQEQEPVGVEMQDFELIATDYCDPLEFTAGIELPAAACAGKALSVKGTYADQPILTNWSAPEAVLDSLYSDSIQLVYNQAGTYEVQYEWSLFGCRDTARAEVEIGEAPMFSLPADSALCPGDSLLLSTALDPDSYELEWQDGSTQAERWAVAPGLYYLTATSLSTRCRSTDSTALTALPLPLVDLGEDIVECAAEWTIGNILDPSWDYIWNTGAALPETTVAQSGTYRLSVTNNEGCTGSDSLEVSLLARPQFRYSSDTSFCPGRPILLNARAAGKDSLTFLWPDGSSGNTFQPDQPGTYPLIASNAACKDTVAIAVEAGDCQSEVFLPTAFSPNGDGRNDIFQAYGPGIEPLRLQIYHRWGGLLYEGTAADARWDGQADGKAVNAGHYVYVLEYRDRLSLEVRQLSGTVALVR